NTPMSIGLAVGSCFRWWTFNRYRIAPTLEHPTSRSGVTLPPFVPTNQPGTYQLPPPNFAPADFIQWPRVTPFAIASAHDFLPAPPPELTSDRYTESFD